MIIGIPAESFPGERRVALVPETVQRLAAKNIAVRVESGAGRNAWFADDDYRRAGAAIVPGAAALLGQADLVVKIRAPTPLEVESLRAGATLVCLLYPRDNTEVTRGLAKRRITCAVPPGKTWRV